MSRKVRSGAIVLVILVAGATPVAATDHPEVSLSAVRITGVVRPGVPLVHIDPLSPWLIGPASSTAPRGAWTGPRQLLAPRIDPMSPWLLSDSVLQAVGARYDGPVELGDPRFSGRLSVAWSAAPGESAVVRLATPDGSWTGTLDAVGRSGTLAFHIHGTLWGAGSYTGQASLLDITAAGPGSDWDVEGLLFSPALLAME